MSGAVVGLLTGCHTLSPLPPVDLADGGWEVHRGQALWKPSRARPEIAGELVVATRPDGGGWVQFAKEPFPLVTAQAGASWWQVRFVPQNRTLGGRGRCSARWSWLQLLRALCARPVEPPWRFEGRAGTGFRLENPATGEELKGFLLP